MNNNKDKIELLNKLKKDIKRLEYELKANKRKVFSPRNLKICKTVAKKVSPYIVSGAIIICGGNFITKNKPFVFDDIKNYASITTELDSSGTKRETKEYVDYVEYLDYEKEDPKLIQYGYFESKDNINFEREIKTYNVKKIDVESLKKIMYENIEEDLECILDKKPTIAKEYVYDKNDDVLNQKPHITLLFNSLNKNDYIIKKESPLNNLVSSTLYVVSYLIVSLIISFKNASIHNDDLSKNIKKILVEYDNKKESNIIEKKLKIKKETYKRLKG